MKISRQKIRQLVREELAKARKKIAETRLNSVDKAWPQLDSGPPCPYCTGEEACEETCPSMTGELNEPCPECGGSHTESDSVPSMYAGNDQSLSCHDCKQTFVVDPFKGGYGRGSKMREADAPQTQKRPKNLWHGFPVSDKKEDPLGGKKSPFGASKSGAKKSSSPPKQEKESESLDEAFPDFDD